MLQIKINIREMSAGVKITSYLLGAVVVTEVETVDVVNCEEEAVEPVIAKLKLKIAFFSLKN